MGYYLLDNPPASPQFYPSRNNGLSGGVVIHTTEGAGGDTAAENTAGFISRRSDPGSYHMIVDTDSSVAMMPDDYVAFGDRSTGIQQQVLDDSLSQHVRQTLIPMIHEHRLRLTEWALRLLHFGNVTVSTSQKPHSSSVKV